MTNITIKPVTLDDVFTIASLKKAVWPDETADPEQISSALQTPSHQAFLATLTANSEEKPAGFISCFATTSHPGAIRWEVDLLAVHPDFQRQGIGGQLIKAALTAGQSAPAQQSRALIQINNIGSQKSFAKQGYQTNHIIYTLFISTQPAPLQKLTTTLKKPLDTDLVQVNTFNYQGIWLEGALSANALSAAQTTCHKANLNLVGALIPDAQNETQALARASSFEAVARFHWWVRPI